MRLSEYPEHIFVQRPSVLGGKEGEIPQGQMTCQGERSPEDQLDFNLEPSIHLGGEFA